VGYGQKKPMGPDGGALPGWTDLRLSSEALPRYFADRRNVGVLLGEPSGGLVDVDIDHQVAVRLVGTFLPPTGAVFGRSGKPRSHWLYQAPGADNCKFVAPDGTVLVEIHSTGRQTVFPGSSHEGTGEAVEWDTAGDPAIYDKEELRTIVGWLAAASLLVLHFPSRGIRDETALALAGALLQGGVRLEAVERFIEIVAMEAGCDDVKAKVSKFRSTQRSIERGKPVAGIGRLRKLLGEEIASRLVEWSGLTKPSRTLTNTACTDAANAERLVRAYGDDLWYVFPWGRWYIWDDERWVRDQEGTLELRAIEIARSIHNEAREAVGKAEQEALSRWAIQSQNKAKIDNMVSLARSYLAAAPDDFDAEPWLLCVKNGTINLKGESLGQFDRNHLITKQGGVVYDRWAKCPGWLAFLKRAMGGDQEMVAFLKRTVGYMLTSDTSEQCFFILCGEGANGKSTFIEVIRGLLGDYARPTEFKTLIDGNRGDGVRNDIAALCGLRLVTSVEANPSRRFDEALIKQLTGGDKITARLLYQEFFDFHPTFKLMLAVNQRPEIRGVDEGMWRRVRLIPFDVTIPPEEPLTFRARIVRKRHDDIRRTAEIHGAGFGLAPRVEQRP